MMKRLYEELKNPTDLIHRVEDQNYFQSCHLFAFPKTTDQEEESREEDSPEEEDSQEDHQEGDIQAEDRREPDPLEVEDGDPHQCKPRSLYHYQQVENW